MNLIDRDFLTAKLEITEGCLECKWVDGPCCKRYETFVDACQAIFEAPVIEQPEVIYCKDCKFYSPMNRETKTGICNLTMHQNFGDNWFCAGAERRADD